MRSVLPFAALTVLTCAAPLVARSASAAPAETPPTETPPAETPPAETAPAETPPARSVVGPATLVVVGGLGLVPSASITAFKVLLFVAGLGACAAPGVEARAGYASGGAGARYQGCLGKAASFGDTAYLSPFVWIPELAGTALAILGGVWFAQVAREPPMPPSPIAEPGSAASTRRAESLVPAARTTPLLTLSF